MKRIIPVVLLFPVWFTACKTKCIEDSGNHVEKSITVKNFDKIDVSGKIRLILKQDSSFAVKIGTDSSLIDYVKIEVSGTKLIIKEKELTYCGQDSIVVEAGIGKLKELTASGSVKFFSAARLNAEDVKINLSGVSDATLDLNAASLTSNLEGVSKLKLSGQSGSHQLNIKGNGEVNAFDFIAGAYKIDITGNAKANINVLNELNVKTEGSSEIFYKGNPKKVNEKKSGAVVLQKVN